MPVIALTPLRVTRPVAAAIEGDMSLTSGVCTGTGTTPASCSCRRSSPCVTELPFETLDVVCMDGTLRGVRPLTETVTVSIEPVPLGPSICVVDSVRKSEVEALWGTCGCTLDDVEDREDVLPLRLSQGIGVRVAPLTVSSS